MSKACTKCGNEYPAIRKYFFVNNSKSDGLCSDCKVCNSKAQAHYRKKNLDKYRRYSLNYYYRNKDKCYAKQLAYKKTLNGYVSFLINSIKQRCYNPKNVGRDYYSGRGIELCFDRNELLMWLEENKIDPRGLVVHRIDSEGDYTLDNIEFITKSEHTRLHNLKG